MDLQVIDGKLQVIETVTNQVQNTFTREEIVQMISDIQSQIDYLEEQKAKKQVMLDMLGE